ncbi:MAG: VWA domain-containing protein [Bacteroidaceae bacterium]|nr:VWA domain-containing protein [Bacteroidaceae bacterium]
MFRFENPLYLYALAIIPLLALLHYGTNVLRRRRLRKYGDPSLLKPLMPDVSRWRPEVKFWLLTAALAMMIVCLARPQYGTKIDTRKRKGIEAIIALDVSNSMLAEDVKPSRLAKSKMLLSNLIDNMTDDKVGLIVYAGDAYTQLPITSDYVSAKMFLDNISPAMISVQGTDIARAIELATHSFTQQQGVGRAIFVITDGEDNEGGAVEAARAAQKKGMNVYVLGVGSPEGAPIPMPGSNGYITDHAGNTVVSKLNEDMCREIASAGGGAYIYVDNSSSAQSALQKHVDRLAKVEIESQLYSEFDEHFRDFAWMALVLLIIEILLLARQNHVFGRFRLFRVPGNAAAVMLIALFVSLPASAQQKNDRYYVRHGNRLYRDSVYAKAQVDYQKAIEKDNTNAVAHYNLGNAHLYQGQPQDAMKSYETAARLQKDKMRGAQVYHNMGVILQSQKQFAEAIECYKNALRRNPKDDETRYNLALCLHQLKNQSQDQNQQNQDQQDQKQEQEQQQQQQQQDQQKQEQQEQQQEQPKMSRENAEQMLKAAMQDEKQTQDKVNKAQQQQQRQRRQLQKQW